MATMTKRHLSGSTSGRGIKVTTAGPIDGSDTAIHTAIAGSTARDLVTLFAYNSDSVARVLHLGWGGTTLPDDGIILTIPSKEGLVLVTADLSLSGGLAIVASADAVNVITIHGYVNRVTD